MEPFEKSEMFSLERNFEVCHNMICKLQEQWNQVILLLFQYFTYDKDAFFSQRVYVERFVYAYW